MIYFDSPASIEERPSRVPCGPSLVATAKTQHPWTELKETLLPR